MADIPPPGGGAHSVVDIGIGFRWQVPEEDYWPIENQALDFDILPLSKWYKSVGRKPKRAGHSILSLL